MRATWRDGHATYKFNRPQADSYTPITVMKHVLALDQGTTSSRAIVFDRRGRAVGSAQHEFAQHFPKPGWVEHEPEDLWRTTRAAAIGAMRAAGVTRRDIAAVGITNQRETTVVWDRKTGRPIHRAIVWQDRRTAAHCASLRAAGHARRVRARTGLVLDPYFSGTKIAWLLDHVRGARTRARDGRLAFGTVDTWLLWKLTGGTVHATDATNASRTLLANLRTGDWDDSMLRLLKVPRAILPEIRDSSGTFGEVTAVPELRGVPVCGIAGDQHAALFGQACFEAGMAKNTYGTGCFMLMHTGDKPVASRNRLLTTPAWRIGGRTEYALEGSVFIGGAVVQWLRDGLGLVKKSSEIEALARKVPDNGGVYLVPAFTGLGAPHWDASARGLIAGITRGTTAAHFARAALESIALQVADLIAAMESDSGIPLAELRVDGGASVNPLLMQFQADLLGTAVVRPKVVETTALGAAYFAGLAAGVWESRDEIASLWKRDRAFKPRREHSKELNAIRAGWRAALERAKGWAKE
ncbi:MAG TPA: glycerol kinase GlpK [Opitutaceae bacterium]